ncbi:transposase [Oscillochloris sp. ZM17-4]|uniref:transposase n=1 Tax=Oscillochloris sp. ZM17-4 TaxID=2866714 RepID=UPI001C731592|nr:transposase [Oscillochloris sp. ZM17-4]MBX0331447.1 transposase [Oscillochloris sp. ZM17-4]
MPYDAGRHHRRSIRLPGYDYRRPGAYFITICAQIRGDLFGEIIGGTMAPNAYGEAIATCWEAIPRHHARVALDIFVLMPDHLHGVILLHGEAPERKPPPAGRPRGTVPGSIPAIIQSFKSVSTRTINRMCGTPGARVWQEDYYEHIIRDEADMDRIRRYIAENPSRWHR